MRVSPVRRCATLLGCTEGQAYTALLGAGLAVTLTVTGLPGVFDAAPVAATAASGAAAPPPAPTTAPTPSPPSFDLAPAELAPGAPLPDPAPLDLPPPTASLDGDAAQILDVGWAYAATGTPLDTVDLAFVPTDGLPVAARAGTANKVTYLRVSSATESLTLGLVDDPGANQLDAAATIWVCPTTSAEWKGTPRQDVEQAPTYDCGEDRARPATRADDGTWVFDLTAIPVRDGHRDLVLVPARDQSAAGDFQVVFRRPSS